MVFAECLNNTCVSVPEPGSKEDIMLQSCEFHITQDDPKYPTNAMHVFAQNEQCDEWNARKTCLTTWNTLYKCSLRWEKR